MPLNKSLNPHTSESKVRVAIQAWSLDDFLPPYVNGYLVIAPIFVSLAYHTYNEIND